MQADWNRHGRDAFVFTIVERVDDPALVKTREQHWIDTFSAVDSGYNVVAKGRVFTPEHRAALAAAQRGKVQSEETKAKRAASLRGRKRGPHTAEARAKISAAQKGVPKGPMSDAHKAALSAARRRTLAKSTPAR